MNKKYTFVADFETGKTEDDKCFVWLWCMVSLEGKYKKYGYDIPSFFHGISQIKSKSPIVIYFHNLKYDGSYLFNFLLNEGYTYVDGYDLQPKQYTCVIANGVWYSCTIRTETHTITFKDSLKLLPMSVQSIGKLVETSKGDLGEHYNITDINYLPSQDDIDYCFTDCDIVRQGLLEMFKLGINKLTIAGSSYADCKSQYKNDWDTLFPDISDMLDDKLRRGYVGGWCYVNPDIENNIVGKGGVIDVNSLYPSVLYSKRLPCGLPSNCINEDLSDEEIAIYRIKLNCELKKGYLPTIMKKTSRFVSKLIYYTNCEDMELWVTNIDLQLIKDHYNCNYSILEGYKFKTMSIDDNPLHNYIDKWIKVKVKATEQGNKVLRQISKLMLNSIYGKFGSRRVGFRQHPVLDNDIMHLQPNITPEQLKPYYLPLAIFCTSYARDKTIRTAQLIHSLGKFCYSDTDSIHFTDLTVDDLRALDIDIHPSNLGAWDYEKSFDRAKFIRQKCYIEETDGVLDVKICGCPSTLNGVPIEQMVTFDNFNVGLTLDGKLTQQSLSGGTYLYETSFTLK